MSDIAKEKKSIVARARANDVYECIDRIWRLRDQVRSVLMNFDPAIGDHATRRDCDAFWQRLRDLGLEDIAKLEANRTRATPDSADE